MYVHPLDSVRLGGPTAFVAASGHGCPASQDLLIFRVVPAFGTERRREGMAELSWALLLLGLAPWLHFFDFTMVLCFTFDGLSRAGTIYRPFTKTSLDIVSMMMPLHMTTSSSMSLAEHLHLTRRLLRPSAL